MKIIWTALHQFAKCSALCVALLAYSSGCQEPGYRTEVVANQQGGVEVHRIEKSPAESFSPAPIQVAPRPVGSPQGAPAREAVSTSKSIDERIEALEARERNLHAEIERLKQEKDKQN